MNRYTNKYINQKKTIAQQIDYENKEFEKFNHIKLKKPQSTRIIAITNQKGGVGKTTSTVNIAAALAKKGLKVLVIDIDQQSNASTALNAIPNANNKTIYDLLTNDSVKITDVIKKSNDNLFILPSSIKLSNLELKLNDKSLLKAKLSNRAELKTFDYIFIDCPPSMGIFTLNALIYTNEILIPIQCEYYALEGLAQIMKNISDIKTMYKTQIVVTGILMTMFSMKNNLSNEVVDEVRKHFPLLIFDSIIPRTVKIAEAPSFQKTIIDYMPKSMGAIAYMKSAIELSDKNI